VWITADWLAQYGAIPSLPKFKVLGQSQTLIKNNGAVQKSAFITPSG